MREETAEVLADLVRRRPDIQPCEEAIRSAYELVLASQRRGGRLLVCGNGGSAADSLHIVGELLKSFYLPRRLPEALRRRLEATHPTLGPYLALNLQSPIRAVSLVSEAALMTAVINDTAADVVFAQQVLGQGCEGDVLQKMNAPRSLTWQHHSGNLAFVQWRRSGLKSRGTNPWRALEILKNDKKSYKNWLGCSKVR